MKRFITNRIPYILQECRNKRVLDIGCAHYAAKYIEKQGWLHREISKVAKYVVGIDIEKEAIEYMNEHGFKAHVANAQDFDIRNIEPELFDVIVCGDIIEHLTNPGGLISSALKHLSKNGTIILSTVNGLGFLFIIETLLLGHETLDDDHTMTFSKKQIYKMIEKCNCKIVDFQYTNEIGSNRHEWFAKYLYKPIWWIQCLVSYIWPAFSKGILIKIVLAMNV